LEEAIIFLLLYAFLVFTDLVPVYKNKNKKIIIICTSIFVFAFVLQFLIILDVQLPKYADWMEAVVKIVGYPGVK